MLKVSIDGNEPVEAKFAVLYSDDAPVAAVAQHDNAIYYVDSARDREELITLLMNLGVPINNLHQKIVQVRGQVVQNIRR